MTRLATFQQHLSAMVNAEGRRLALLEAAEHLEWELQANDIGPAKKTLRCDGLYGIAVPESAVAAVVADLRRQARELEVERRRMETARIAVPPAVDMHGSIGTVQDETPIALPLRMAR